MTTLNQAIHMRKVTRNSALVEGNRCALHLAIKVQFQHLAPFETEIFTCGPSMRRGR